MDHFPNEAQFDRQVALGLVQPRKEGDFKSANPWPDLDQLMAEVSRVLDEMDAKHKAGLAVMDVPLVNVPQV